MAMSEKTLQFEQVPKWPKASESNREQMRMAVANSEVTQEPAKKEDNI